MARQVPRRNKLQLILLIVFCVLFVIATALAILGLVNYDKASQENQALAERLSEIEKENSNLEGDARDMVMLITGKAGTVHSAKKQAEIAYQATEEAGGLAVELIALAGKYKDKNKLVNDLNIRIADLQQKLDLQKKQQETLVVARQADEKKFKVKEAQLNANLIEEQKKRDEVFTQARKNVITTRRSLGKTVRLQTKQIEKLTEDHQIKSDEIARIKDQLAKTTETRTGAGEVKLEADGKIAKIVPGANICYIDRGTDEHIRRGMTFSVYPGSSAGQSKVKAKGTIRVTRPMDNYSECEIVKEESGYPIMKNDIIASVAYHASRTHVFVVAGDFDLHNTGRATKHDAEEVRNTIRQAGGKIATKLSIRTDYVVMGAKPPKPTAPAEDALPANQKIYQRQMRRYNDYLALEKKAKDLGIPVLNTNRFLQMTGYKPQQIAK